MNNRGKPLLPEGHIISIGWEVIRWTRKDSNHRNRYLCRCRGCGVTRELVSSKINTYTNNNSQGCESCRRYGQRIEANASFQRKYLNMSPVASYSDIGFPTELFKQFISTR